MTKSDICRSFRDQYPDLPTAQLARIIRKKRPMDFDTAEQARDALRYIEGKRGNTHRNKVITTKYFMKEQRPLNPYNLPDTYQKQRPPFKLPLACNNILLISDLHIPYHDIGAITTAFDYGKKNKVNTIFINGDLIDMANESKFERDWSKRSTKEEFAAAKQFLISMRKTFPAAEIYWMKGNHDTRWEKFLMKKAPEIWDDEYFYLEQRLALHEQRVKILDDKTLVKAGKLSIAHGHHIFKGVFTPVNPARGAFLRAKQSIIVGHLHQPSYHPETTADGTVIGCWSTGCLCELRPDYSPIVGNSRHGFAHITVERSGDFTVKNFQIINGKLH